MKRPEISNLFRRIQEPPSEYIGLNISALGLMKFSTNIYFEFQGQGHMRSVRFLRA